MINPYTLYCVGFSIALVLYALGWSELYPPLALPLVMFLLFTILINGILSFYWSKNNSIKITPVSPVFKPLYVTIFIFSLWIIEFIYGGVPLFKILLNESFDYRLFGVPSLHVFVVTFSSFYTVYLFHLYITEKKKSLLVLYLINLLVALLIFNRGMFLFNLSGSLFIYLFTLPRLSYGKVILTVIALPLLFYFFGVLGNIRVSHLAKRKNYDATIFLDIGRANESFKASIIPKEYFWLYIYATSPLANLQTNVDQERDQPSNHQWLGFVSNELVFDFISKRTNRLLNIDPIKDSRIEGPFNVSTVYSKSYSYCGWAGMKIMALFLLILPLVYKKILRTNNEFAPTGIAILCTLYLFLVFDNTVRFTGLAFQLVYPILFPVVGLAYKRIWQ